MKAPIVQRLTYGTNEPGKPFLTESGCWRRVDTYRPDKPQRYLGGGIESEIRESRFAAGPDDTSEPFIGYSGSRYDSRCTSCYLNHSHTIACHEKSIADHERAITARK